jgi:hypothetical protein
MTLISLLGASITVASAVAPLPGASAATGCTDNNRSLAASIAASGNFMETASVYTEAGIKITLRYSSDYGCAWGLLSGATTYGVTTGYVWIDRSADSGSSWQGLLGEVTTGGTKSSTYTGTFSAVNNNAIRACGQDSVYVPLPGKNTPPPKFMPIVCTPWFFPGRLFSGGTLGGPGFSSLISPSNRYSFIMQGDGNLVEYSSGRPVWATGTSTGGTILRMQSDGNLVLIAPGNRPVWASGTNGNPGAYLSVQNDGNVVIYNAGNRAIWATNTVGR